MQHDLDEVRDRRAMDTNRSVLRQVVGHVREHMAEDHQGEDRDCAGVMAALEDASLLELLTLLNTALCHIARMPDPPEVAALALLDFTPSDDADPAPDVTP